MSGRAKLHTLPSGLRVITAPDTARTAATVLVLVEAGSKYETEATSGLSHFLEHMAFKGTAKRPRPLDLSAEFDSLGAHRNASTSHEYTAYWATVQPQGFTRVLDLLADMYLNSELDAAEIERERGVIIEEINMYEDMPARQVQDLFLELLYEGQPAGRDIAGTKATVTSFQRDDFKRYRAEHYVAAATVVVVAGPFAEGEIVAAVQSAFAALGTGAKSGKVPVVEAQAAPAVRLKYKNSDQTHLVLGVRGKPLTHQAHLALELAAAVLGGGMSSRLFRRVREELGAAYYVRAYNDVYTDHGYLAAAVGADTRRVHDIIAIMLEEFSRLAAEPVGEAELGRVKEAIVGGLWLELETSAGVAEFYGLQEILKRQFWQPAEAAERIMATTPADIQAIAQEVMVANGLNLALIGPFDDPAPFVAALRL